MIGLEPSAILSFRDEYPDLVNPALQAKARALAKYTYLFEEWFDAEIQKGHILKESFTHAPARVMLHGHCHQKALSSMNHALAALSLPENYSAELIPSGCCGMAGSFGYEKEHYGLSMKIGELVLFPAIRNNNEGKIIAAAGTSCRHQIKDGTEKVACHPAEILYNALLPYPGQNSFAYPSF
jgi:Fe-S oxidoreductase